MEQIYKENLKPTLDKLVALAMTIIALPVGLAIAALVYFQHQGSVLFVQERPGRNGESFTIYKFLTMYELYDASGKPLPDEERISKIGAFLRKTSLDELPQLINVLKGDMSLVGPRPLLAEYLPLYSNEHKRRHDVLPGMTGWAQVNKDKAIQWKDKFDLDIWYIKNISFLLDVKILALTFTQVFSRRNTPDASIFEGKFKGL